MPRFSNQSSPFQSPTNRLVNVAITFPPNSRWTKQEFRDEADINTIMAKYQSTGEMPVLNQVAPQYLDATNLTDFHDLQNQVLAAQALFGQLPSKLRDRFGNDPGSFLDYVQQPSNFDEMYELGLLDRLQRTPKDAPASPQDATK